MRFYIAGKVTGNPDYVAQFAEAAALLVAEGHTVINPAENPEQPDWASYMAISIPQVCASDGIAILPNWRTSRGAKRERYVARLLRKVERYL